MRYCRVLGIRGFHRNVRLKTLLHHRVVWHSKFRYVFTDKINVEMWIRWRLLAKHVIPFEVGLTRSVWMIWQVARIAIINGLSFLNLLHDLLRELVARSYERCVVVKDLAFGHTTT